MNTMTMTGMSASVKWGRRDAVIVGAWSMTGHPEGGGTLTASVVSSDAFRVTQAPLTFVHPNGTWAWPVLSLQITGNTLTALLGP